jgi:hypothetical protein
MGGNKMKTKQFEVYTEDGDYYGFVEIPLTAPQPEYVVVDGVICEGDGNGIFIRKEPEITE